MSRGINGVFMRIIISAIILFSLSACSTNKSVLKIVGLDRINIDQESYDKPDFYLDSFKASNNRAPASIVKKVEVDK